MRSRRCDVAATTLLPCSARTHATKKLILRPFPFGLVNEKCSNSCVRRAQKWNSMKTVAMTTACAVCIYPHLVNWNWHLDIMCECSFTYITTMDAEQTETDTESERVIATVHECFTISVAKRCTRQRIHSFSYQNASTFTLNQLNYTISAAHSYVM